MTFLSSKAWYFASLALFLLASIVDNAMIIYLRKRNIPTGRWLSEINSRWSLKKSMVVKLVVTVGILFVFYSGDMLMFRGDVVAAVYAVSVCISLRRHLKILEKQKPEEP